VKRNRDKGNSLKFFEKLRQSLLSAAVVVPPCTQQISALYEGKRATPYSQTRHYLEVCFKLHAPAALSWKVLPDIHCLGELLDARTGLRKREIYCPPRESNRTVWSSSPWTGHRGYID
jgi:hypothetical protein